MAPVNDDDYGVIRFRGQELAARWWRLFGGRLFVQKLDNLPRPVAIAANELTGYMLDSMPGIERWLKPDDALRLGFEMGFTFQQALAEGRLEHDDLDDVQRPIRLPGGLPAARVRGESS